MVLGGLKRITDTVLRQRELSPGNTDYLIISTVIISEHVNHQMERYTCRVHACSSGWGQPSMVIWNDNPKE